MVSVLSLKCAVCQLCAWWSYHPCASFVYFYYIWFIDLVFIASAYSIQIAFGSFAHMDWICILKYYVDLNRFFLLWGGTSSSWKESLALRGFSYIMPTKEAEKKCQADTVSFLYASRIGFSSRWKCLIFSIGNKMNATLLRNSFASLIKGLLFRPNEMKHIFFFRRVRARVFELLFDNKHTRVHSLTGKRLICIRHCLIHFMIRCTMISTVGTRARAIGMAWICNLILRKHSIDGLILRLWFFRGIKECSRRTCAHDETHWIWFFFSLNTESKMEFKWSGMWVKRFHLQLMKWCWEGCIYTLFMQLFVWRTNTFQCQNTYVLDLLWLDVIWCDFNSADGWIRYGTRSNEPNLRILAQIVP